MREIMAESMKGGITLERLFSLDAQLLFDVVINAFNIFVLFLLLSYLLFNPARKLLRDRQDRIKNQLDDAARDKADAAQLKTEYENKLNKVHKETESLLSEARKKAMLNERQIVAEAQEEGVRIRQRAAVEIQLEKEKAQDEMKQQIVLVATQMAGKVIGASVDEKRQDELIQETLKEMGGNVWQS